MKEKEKNMSEERDRELIREAIRARENAYTPYSHFRVGAALLTADGRIYHGCNIENSAFSPTNCAERTAFFTAVSDGVRAFSAIAIVAGPEDGKLVRTSPCGVCRQVMREFCDPAAFRVLLAVSEDDWEEWTLGKLLPASFGPEYLL